MFLGIKYISVSTQGHFLPSQRQGLKLDQDIFLVEKINVLVIIYFGGHGKIRTEKMTTKQCEQLRNRA